MVKGDFSLYNRGSSHDTSLPIYGYKPLILKYIETERFSIIRGESGCGKTTQVPQFILDEARANKMNCNIVVTQPNRLTAISVARRVAEQRNCPLGTLVGYQVGQNDMQLSRDTKILYVTTDVLLGRLVKDRRMEEFTHYILDEIHERDQDIDFLLLISRHVLNYYNRLSKLIVMSATIDVEEFWNYLQADYDRNEIIRIPPKPLTINVNQQYQFKVSKFFLDTFVQGKFKILEAVSLIPFEPDTPTILPDAYKTAARIIHVLDNATNKDGICNKKAAILVFLPGLDEITIMDKILKAIRTDEKHEESFWIKWLHSSMTAEEQQEVFNDPPRSSMRKIILSTNVAESSVTIPDVESIIDFCLTKILVTDPVTNRMSFELAWASKNCLIQRAGRVGRVKDGRVFRMITKSFYETYLKQETTPEILRIPLENLILKAKLFDIVEGSPKDFLARAINPPDLRFTNQVIALLKESAALNMCIEEDMYVENNGDLTFFGRVIAMWPLNICLRKLIYLGKVFGIEEECIIMACAMSTENMFCMSHGKYSNIRTYREKLFWADSSCSDPILFLSVYKSWRNVQESMNKEDLESWMHSNSLRENVLKEIFALVEDFKRRLEIIDIFFEDDDNDDIFELSDNDRATFLKLVLAAAFYPNYFFRGTRGGDEKETVDALGGRHPFSSVYLTGLPQNHPTVIYKKTIQKMFKYINEEFNVNVDHSSKAYVTFLNPVKDSEDQGIPNKIEENVYIALHMRQIGSKFSIPKLEPEEAERLYKKYLDDSMKSEDSNFQIKKIDNKKRKVLNEAQNEPELGTPQPSGSSSDVQNQRIVDSTFDDIELFTNENDRSEITLKGPFSPLEMKLTSAIRATSGKLVEIELGSVNSVLLEEDPSDVKERMVISAFVGINPSEDRLFLKETTLMPNVPALPMLCCLMFAPMVELRCDPEFTTFLGALCGIGYDAETNESLFPENDMEIAFDHKMNNEKLYLVNKVRELLGMAFDLYAPEKAGLSPKTLRSYFRRLLMPESTADGEYFELEETYYTAHSYQWGLVDNEKLIDPCPGTLIPKADPTEDIMFNYRLIWAPILKNDDYEGSEEDEEDE